LQIDTDLLLIITSTAEELSSGTNSDDIELNTENRVLVIFLWFPAETHFKSELRRNHWR